MKSFCIKLLCFSKIWFFQIFDRLNLFLDRSKLRLKFCFESAWFDWCSIAVGSFECIFDRSNLFFDQSKIAQRVFFKTISFSRVQHFFKIFKSFSLSFHSIKDSKQDFCCFPSNLFKGFCLLRPVKPFYPSFFIYFHVSCI